MDSNTSLLGRRRTSYSSAAPTRLKRSVEQHVIFPDSFDYDKDPYRPGGRTHVGTSTSETYPVSVSRPGSINNSNNNDSISDSVNDSNRMFETLPYYLPCFSWLPEYTLNKLWGDIIAGISLASFQIPLALSYTTSIAHVPPLCGLYSLAISPFVYGIFGSVPQMIVGPESAISLVVGQAVESITLHKDNVSLIDISIVITFVSGAILLFSGISRFGFLGNVLSKALLRGFISSVGLVMIINSLISELKLDKFLVSLPQHYHTPFEKVLFLIDYAPAQYHKPTAIFSGCCLVILFFMRFIKRKLVKHHKSAVFFPDILFVVIITILISMKFGLKQKYGITIVGDFSMDNFDKLKNPLTSSRRKLIPDLFSASLIVAMLGFFESTTASKSLGTTYNLTVSSNRELVALGFMNIVISLFGALPSFGGYGRSKINALSGAQSLMSGVFVGIITLITMKLLLQYVHYIPNCVLSVITTVIGTSLLEEVPGDIKFHLRCGGYSEICVFAVTFGITIFYSIEAGICIGCVYSIINIIKHSAKSRIQILARVEGTSNFTNLDDYLRTMKKKSPSVENRIEEIEGCMIVRIPEPLTFTNSEDLKQRLDRIEKFGSSKIHPGRKSFRSKDSIKYVIFDLGGMTSIDSSAAQVLDEIITSYKRRNVFIYLANVSIDDKIRTRLLKAGVTRNVERVRSNTNEAGSSGAYGDTRELYTPYFDSIDGALNEVEKTKTKGNNTSNNDSESFMSTTLFNSSLV
ncbi:YPR003C [Saccharomyces arboricola H-6]|uniref:YPR003C n=1 Tax=Saccharomyces arboricola (strain H-6 / AS 2.3317 / CBS 10644) TaxID=1160507 RepID=J8PVC1_SACAR|nr:YPR003C [Saccharomyces arboricola H-6]